MILYCDRLNWPVVLRVFFLSFYKGGEKKVIVFELPAALETRLCSLFLRFLKYRLEEADVSAGQMICPNGESVAANVRKLSASLTVKYVSRLLMSSTHLSALSSRWGRQVIFKYLAMDIEFSLYRPLSYLMMTAVLAKDGDINSYIAERPHYSEAIDIAQTGFKGKVCWYTPFLREEKVFRYTSLLAFPGVAALAIVCSWVKDCWGCLFNRRRNNKTTEGAVPSPTHSQGSVLMVQEEVIHLDPLVRSQLYWLLNEEGRVGDRPVYILEQPLYRRQNELLAVEDQKRLKSLNIHLLTEPFWAGTLVASDPKSKILAGKIWVEVLKTLSMSLTGTREERRIVFWLWLLLRDALKLTLVCQRHDVKTFFCSENYLRLNAALHLVADELGIRTVSCQYSNMGYLSTLMMSNNDVMAVFSSRFQEVFAQAAVHPAQAVPIGYVFDFAFSKLKNHSQAHRMSLAAHGARFVICFFDENFVKYKYGFWRQQDHCDEIEEIYNFILRNKDVGLIFKGQFRVKEPGRMSRLESLRQEVLSTGRYLELAQGSLRNLIFPCEAAMAADITIGHKIGASASLESALAGVRSILIDPCSYRVAQDPLYERCDILYPNLSAALQAIDAYRRGDAQRVNLGNWTGILNAFDPFNDGQSRERLCRLIAP